MHIICGVLSFFPDALKMCAYFACFWSIFCAVCNFRQFKRHYLSLPLNFCSLPIVLFLAVLTSPLCLLCCETCAQHFDSIIDVYDLSCGCIFLRVVLVFSAEMMTKNHSDFWFWSFFVAWDSLQVRLPSTCYLTVYHLCYLHWTVSHYLALDNKDVLEENGMSGLFSSFYFFYFVCLKFEKCSEWFGRFWIWKLPALDKRGKRQPAWFETN